MPLLPVTTARFTVKPTVSLPGIPPTNHTVVGRCGWGYWTVRLGSLGTRTRPLRIDRQFERIQWSTCKQWSKMELTCLHTGEKVVDGVDQRVFAQQHRLPALHPAASR